MICKPFTLAILMATSYYSVILVAADNNKISNSDVECHGNCDKCTGPGEYQCTTCKTGFCMEDEQYRMDHYEGVGRCWNLDCHAKDKSDESSSSSSQSSSAVAATSFASTAACSLLNLAFII